MHQIKIDKIPTYIHNSIMQFNNLKEENKKIIEKTKDLYLQYNIDKYEIEEYVKEKPLFLQYKRDKYKYPKYPEWIENPVLFDEASRKIGKKIEPHILYKRMKWIYTLPHEYTTIIKKIMAIDKDYLNI